MNLLLEANLSIVKATTECNLNLVKQSLEIGADIDAKTDYGNTLAHIAVSYGKKQILELLLSKGANPYVTNTCGLNPLDIARHKQRENPSETITEIIGLLEEGEKKWMEKDIVNAPESNIAQIITQDLHSATNMFI